MTSSLTDERVNRGAALLRTFEPQCDATRVSLSQDPETTLPELTEQQRIRQKEEDLSGLESVHMAESETECAAPGLHKLEPECVSAHGGVSDVHHTHTSLIKTETDLGSPYTGDLKIEDLDSAELQCMSSLHSDQIKTESVDDGYFKVEDISELEDIQCVIIKSDHIKCEPCEYLESDVMNTVSIRAAVGLNDQTESGQCAGEPNQTCRNYEINLLTKCEDLYHNCDSTNENTHHRNILQKSISSRKKHIDGKRTSDRNQRKINVSEKRYGCTWCGKCFSQKSSLNLHKRNHSDEKPYTCTQCGMCFSQKSSLNLHKRNHSDEKPYTCTQCGMCFSQKSYLNLHKKNHSGEKPCKCTECGRCFSRISGLNRHKMIHTGEKPHKCTQCAMCFPQIYSLNNHKMIHSGEKPHKCTYCGKCFSQKSSLNLHERIHSGEKPCKCTQCGKCFSRKSYLIKHMMIHSGEKPYQCTQCGQCFSQKSSLTRHIRIHTGEKPYKCAQCGKCFARISRLNYHLRIHTG